MNDEHVHSPIPYRVYIIVWLCLVVLTGITVGVSYLDMRNAAIMLAVMIASVKAMLVMLYFMHVRYDKPIVAYMIAVTAVVYAVFFGLTMSDYWYR